MERWLGIQSYGVPEASEATGITDGGSWAGRGEVRWGCDWWEGEKHRDVRDEAGGEISGAGCGKS